jgi:hypothetical protein
MRHANTLLLALAVPFLLARCCCDDDDDCWWDVECYWTPCCYTCYDVYYCDYYYYGEAVQVSEEIDFDAKVLDAGEGRVDILVQVLGKGVEGERPVSVRLLGPSVSGVRRESPKRLWVFHGVPIAAADRIEVSIPETGARTVRMLDLAKLDGVSPCDPRQELSGRKVFPEMANGQSAASEILVQAPRVGEVLPSASGAIGFAVEVFRPSGGAPETTFLREEGSTSIPLDEPGRWFFRVVLLTDDLCGEESADSLIIEETELLVP